VAVLAEGFGAVSLAAISKAITRAELRRQEDPKWNRLLANLEKQLLGKTRPRKVKCQDLTPNGARMVTSRPDPEW